MSSLRTLLQPGEGVLSPFQLTSLPVSEATYNNSARLSDHKLIKWGKSRHCFAHNTLNDVLSMTRMLLSENTSASICLVYGNEASDLDSVVSSVYMASSLTLAEISADDSLAPIFVPVIRGLRENWKIRYQTRHQLSVLTQGSQLDNLIFEDDLTELLKARRPVGKILVDHNSDSADDGIGTVLVVDHHAGDCLIVDEQFAKLIPKFPNMVEDICVDLCRGITPAARVINTGPRVGSTASLLAMLFTYPTLAIADERHEALRATILLDTNALDSRLRNNRWSGWDEIAVAVLSDPAAGLVRWTANELLGALRNKQQLGELRRALNAVELLLSDSKVIKIVGARTFWATIDAPIREVIPVIAAVKEDVEGWRVFAKQRFDDFDAIVIMCWHRNANGDLIRELATCRPKDRTSTVGTERLSYLMREISEGDPINVDETAVQRLQYIIPGQWTMEVVDAKWSRKRVVAEILEGMNG